MTLWTPIATTPRVIELVEEATVRLEPLDTELWVDAFMPFEARPTKLARRQTGR